MKDYPTRGLRPLDFVLTPAGGIAIVKEVSKRGDASIEYVFNPASEHNAWWGANDLTVVDSLPRVLARTMCHPFSSDKLGADDRAFPLGDIHADPEQG